jgi:dihydrofolate reductase
MSEKTIVVAYNENFVIGDSNGNVPWRIPEDLKFFKEYTMGKACLMGRKTWDSIPVKYKPLLGRTNIVISRDILKINNPGYSKNPMLPANSVEQAILVAEYFCPNQEMCITGGGEIYRYCLENDLVDKVIASEIKGHLDVKGTTFFPNLKELGWKSSVHKEFDEFIVMEYKK